MLFRVVTTLARQLDEHTKELIQGAGLALLLKSVGAGLAFLVNVVLARLLGANGAGIYFLSLAVVTVAATVGRLGLDNSITRFVAANHVSGDWSSIKGVVQKAFGGALVALGLCAGTLVWSAPVLATVVFGDSTLTPYLRAMAVATVPLGLSFLFVRLFLGLRRIAYAQVLRNIDTPLLTVAGTAVLAPLYGVLGAIWAFCIATVGTTVHALFLWRRVAAGTRAVAAVFPARDLTNSCMPLFVMSILSLAMNWGSTLLLGMWTDAEQVGLFGIALRVAMLTNLLLVSTNAIAAPKFAHLFRENRMDELSHVARGAAKLTTVVAMPITAGLVIFPEPILRLFGPEFSAGGPSLAVLAVGYLISAVTGSVGQLLMMTGGERSMRNSYMVGCILTVILSIALIPRLGALGAAIATSAGIASQNAVSAVRVYKVHGINTLFFLRNRRASRSGLRRSA